MIIYYLYHLLREPGNSIDVMQSFEGTMKEPTIKGYPPNKIQSRFHVFFHHVNGIKGAIPCQGTHENSHPSNETFPIRTHVWYIYLHLHYIYRKNQPFMKVNIPVPWIVWVWMNSLSFRGNPGGKQPGDWSRWNKAWDGFTFGPWGNAHFCRAFFRTLIHPKNPDTSLE